MTDFLGAVVRRAIGEPGGLRPAGPPLIPAAAERGRGVTGVHMVQPGAAPPPVGARAEDRGLEAPTPFVDGRDDVGPAPAAPTERHPGPSGRRRHLDERVGKGPSTSPLPDDARSADEPPPDAERLDRPSPLERARPQRREQRPSRPPALVESIADAEVVPVAARAAAFRRATESERPQGTVRPLAAVDRSIDVPRIGDRTPVDADDDGPVVHVSIGRIEVRAPQPQPAAHPTPTPMAPALTLDAYLRRRDGVDRR